MILYNRYCQLKVVLRKNKDGGTFKERTGQRLQNCHTFIYESERNSINEKVEKRKGSTEMDNTTSSNIARLILMRDIEPEAVHVG